LSNWGAALFAQARTKSGDAADRLFQLGIEKYEESIRIVPNASSFLNLGIGFASNAKMKVGEERERLYEQAYTYFDAALKRDPNQVHLFIQWGAALFEHGQVSERERAEELFKQAYEILERGLRLQTSSERARLIITYGSTLTRHAQIKPGTEAQQLLERAQELFQEAIHISPTFYLAYAELGLCLLFQAGINNHEEMALLLEAEKCLSTAEELLPGSATYNLACAYARLGDEEKCRQYLYRVAEIGKLPKREHLVNDPDLADIRGKEWFEELLLRAEG
jgi:tetratricopeptide (TPR) repeat protein